MLDRLKRYLKKAIRGGWTYNDTIKCTHCWNNLKPHVWLSLVVLALILGLFL